MIADVLLTFVLLTTLALILTRGASRLFRRVTDGAEVSGATGSLLRCLIVATFAFTLLFACGYYFRIEALLPGGVRLGAASSVSGMVTPAEAASLGSRD